MKSWPPHGKMAVVMSTVRPRPLVQFSLQGLLVVMAMIAIGLGFYRLVGVRALVHYSFLIFAVGPWFAWLVSECLPVRSEKIRVAVANLTLLALFIFVLKLAEATLDGPVVILMGLAALLLWTPQYMLFFVWKVQER
jgi:hypothetical protein